MRRPLDGFLASGAGDRLLGLLERADSRRPNLLRVLTYHRLGAPDAFERQVRHLARRASVVSVCDLLEALGGGRPLPPRSVMITFDDGYREVGDVAWPLLRAHGLPAVVFVPTAYPGCDDRTFWWDLIDAAMAGTARRDVLESPAGPLPLAGAADRRRAASRLKRALKGRHHADAAREAAAIAESLAPGVTRAPPAPRLGWDDLRRLAGEGLAVASHTRTHPFMDLLDAGAARREIDDSLEDLRRELGGEPLPVFSYPDGGHSPTAVEALRAAGIVAAFTTRRGTNDLHRADPLRLRRINISQGADVPLLRARLVHSTVYLNRWRGLFDRQRSPRADAGARGR